MRWTVLLCLFLAGCSGAAPSSVTADAAAHQADDNAQETFEYALFLGVTGTEGDLNWTAYEEALRDASDPGAIIAGAFDQDQDNGAWGDGQLGSWLTTHFIYDSGRSLLGGLYTQTTPAGTASAFATFRGPYGGTPALPGLMDRTTVDALAGLQTFDDGPGDGEKVLCGIVSSMDEWEIGAAEAAAIALATPEMQEQQQAMPGGELTYFYFPKLGVTPDCPATLDTRSNYWIISLTDLDAFLAGGHPDVVEVTIDAATGETIDVVRRALAPRPSTILDAVFEQTRPVAAPGPQRDAVEIDVQPSAGLLEVEAAPATRPSGTTSQTITLYTPEGDVWDQRAVTDDEIAFRITTPMEGAWTLAYDYDQLVATAYRFDIHAVVNYV